MMEPCETCGVAATEWVRDLQEIEPKADKHGQLWADYEPVDKGHFLCNKHMRQSRIYPRTTNNGKTNE